MAEQVFRSPGFFPREVDQSFQVSSPAGTSVGIIGASAKGPAFSPILISSFREFVDMFGDVDGKYFAPFAAREYLQNGGSIVFTRVLGAGANTTQGHINTTNAGGTVNKAGFQLSPSTITGLPATGSTSQTVSIGAAFILVASHSEVDSTNYPLITEAGFSDTSNAELVRAIIFTENDTSVFLGSYNAIVKDAMATSTGTIDANGLFKIYISASDDGTNYANDKDIAGTAWPGVRILTASLNPNNANYITKVLNTDPKQMEVEKHLLYVSFDVDDEVASATNRGVALLSGSGGTSNARSVTFLNAYGRYDVRYTTPTSPYVISQPYGTREYELFKVESISDGAWANDKYKISIANLKKATSLNNPYGTFTLIVRDFSDTDESPLVIESFPNLNLNPVSENYIGKRIGNKKIKFDFDQVHENDRLPHIEGKYANKSKTIRVILSDDLDERRVPGDALPCGFRGYELLKTSFNEKTNGTIAQSRLVCSGTEARGPWVVPPIPMRRKLTKNTIGNAKEKVDKRLFWGVQFERVSGSATEPNKSSKHNEGIDAFTKFVGHRDFDMLVTGGYADTFNNNKFTLDKVNTKINTIADYLTSSANDVIKGFVYEADSLFNPKSLTDVLMEPPDSNGNIDLTFNTFSNIANFSFFLYGGFDGVDITDKNDTVLNDRSTSTATSGHANTSYSSAVFGANQNGTDLKNATIQSYRRAIEAMSNPDTVDINLLAIPGIREPLITDYAADKMLERFDAFYIMDIEEYDKSATRLFEDATIKPDVKQTRDQFIGRGLDNNFAAAYFPDVVIQDAKGKRTVVPATVAALSAFAFNDRVGQAWFAPAGFNRGSLASVVDVDVRLNFSDRDDLYDSNINPIATFPREGFVIFGQKTLQNAVSALNRISVRRLLIEVRRLIKNVGNSILFEQNTAATRQQFVDRVKPLLERIQIQAGIERFKVIMDDTTTTAQDIQNNTLRGKIFIVPTKTVEYISVDFVVTQNGVAFE